jgi:hypothetical protein
MISFLCYLPAVSLKYIYSFDNVVKRKRVRDSDIIYFPIMLIQCQNKIKEYNTNDQSICIFMYFKILLLDRQILQDNRTSPLSAAK